MSRSGQTILLKSLSLQSKLAPHPTQKPVPLMEYLIKTYSNDGGTVLDNVMGSGTTGIAAIKSKRNFIGIEKEEEYYNSLDRIQSELTEEYNIETL